jgi:hypothetical protein
MNRDPLQEEPASKPPDDHHRFRRGPPHAPPELDEIEGSGNAAAIVPKRDLPATGESDRSVELDSSYWIG